MQRPSEIIEANEDLLIQILLKLPIKSLFRFKCVSIRWLNLISSHYFSQKHSLRNRKCSPCGLFMHQYPSLLYISLGTIENSRPSFGPVSIHDFLKIPRHYLTHLTTLSFSSGLLLCLLLKPRSEIIHFVINPTTKKSNPLPLLRQLKEKPVINMDLAYDPHESPHYRVVCVRQSSLCDENGLYQFEFSVFSSETGSNWRICRGPFTNIPPGTWFNEGVYWNNGMHYLSAWEYIGDDENSFYFKFEEETVELLALPPAIRTTKRSWYMGQSCGHLHLVDTQTDIIHGSTVDIYELVIDYSGWVRLYRVDLGAMGYVFPEMVQYVEVDPFVVEGFNNRRVVRRMGRYYSYNVVAVVRREREEFLEIVLSIPNKIISYNPRSNTTRVLAYFGDDRDRLLYQCTRVVPYISTLSPV